MEEVDILLPPLFTPSGEVKQREQAYKDGDWVGTFNLWIVSRDPEPSIVYQLRSPRSTWAPLKLDVTAGGHYKAGERLIDGLREVEEELGKSFNPSDVVYLGKKLYVGFNTNGTSHNNVVDVYLIEDNSALDSYVLEEKEVYAICKCPVNELIKAHKDSDYSFRVEALTSNGEKIEMTITSDSFPENWDNYHHKIAILTDRYINGDENILY